VRPGRGDINPAFLPVDANAAHISPTPSRPDHRTIGEGGNICVRPEPAPGRPSAPARVEEKLRIAEL